MAAGVYRGNQSVFPRMWTLWVSAREEKKMQLSQQSLQWLSVLTLFLFLIGAGGGSLATLKC